MMLQASLKGELEAQQQQLESSKVNDCCYQGHLHWFRHDLRIPIYLLQKANTLEMCVCVCVCVDPGV